MAFVSGKNIDFTDNQPLFRVISPLGSALINHRIEEAVTKILKTVELQAVKKISDFFALGMPYEKIDTKLPDSELLRRWEKGPAYCQVEPDHLITDPASFQIKKDVAELFEDYCGQSDQSPPAEEPSDNVKLLLEFLEKYWLTCITIGDQDYWFCYWNCTENQSLVVNHTGVCLTYAINLHLAIQENFDLKAALMTLRILTRPPNSTLDERIAKLAEASSARKTTDIDQVHYDPRHLAG